MPRFEIKFENRKRLALAADTDWEIDAAIKRAGLWKSGALYPYFTIYENGEEIGGGGGVKSGVMGTPQHASLKPEKVAEGGAFAARHRAEV